MNNNEILLVLQLARRFWSFEKWTQGAPARNADGRPVHPGSAEATQWCIEGWVGLQYNPVGDTPIELLEILDAAAKDLYGPQLKIQHTHFITHQPEEPVGDYFAYEGVGYVNDFMGYDAVCAVLDQAIKLVSPA